MAKINRRDYLIRMGAAGALAATTGMDIFGQGQRQPNNPECEGALSAVGLKTKSAKPRVWEHEWKTDFPKRKANQVVKLVFYGNAGFGRREAKTKVSCDVGFHKGDNHHHHKLEIHAFDQTRSDPCNRVYDSSATDEKISKLELTIDKPDKDFVNGTFFYQPTQNVNRRRELIDPKDFRWVIDFESDYLYRNFPPSNLENLPKNSGVYRPNINVSNGLFYTLRKTASTFRVQTRDGVYVSDLENVADYIGANIYVEPDSSVTLTVNGTDYDIKAPGEIYFLNHCFEDKEYKHKCNPQSHNVGDKEKRNDFFLHYKGFKLEGKPEHELFLVNSYPQQADLEGLACFAKLMTMSNSDQRMTDEAPCAGAGYGGGEGIPRP